MRPTSRRNAAPTVADEGPVEPNEDDLLKSEEEDDEDEEPEGS